MRIVHSDEDVPWEVLTGCLPSLFLAGPTPRSADTASWRPDAIRLLEAAGYPGIVLVPERRDWDVKFDYVDQVEWELSGLDGCTRLLFWVPRQAPHMLALTTNIEFGYWMARDHRKLAYGRSDDAQNCRYLDWLFTRETKRAPARSLADTVEAALWLPVREPRSTP